MMLPYTIDEIKIRITPIAQKYKLAAVYLFGSYARGDANENSDIDLLVDLSGSTVRGILLGQLYSDLEQALETSIDLVTVSSLKQPIMHNSDKLFRDTINKERKIIYAVA